MFKVIPYRIYLLFFSFLFLISCLCAAWFNLPQILLIPFACLFGWWAIERPGNLFLLLLIIIPWSIEYSFSDTLGTDLPDEPLMLLLSLSILFYILANRSVLNRFGLRHTITFILLAQVVWMAMSVFLSTHPLISVKYLLAKSWYLLAFFATPLLLLRDERLLKKCAVGITISMGVLVLITMVRHAQHGWSFASINESLEPFFRNHVNYSAVLVFVIPITYGVYLLSNKAIAKNALFFLLLLLLIALYFSYARGAWLALLTGMLTYWLLRRKLLFAAFILFFAGVLVLAGWLRYENNYVRYAHHYNTTIFHTNFEEHLVATYRLEDVSTAERFYRWIAGVRMIGDRWQTGYGPNTFYENYKPYGVPAFKTWVSDNKDRSTVHNYFLLTFIEQGVVGFILLLVLLGSFFWYAQRVYEQTMDRFWKIVTATNTVVFVMICTVNFLSDLVETDKVGSFFYLSIAILVVTHQKSLETRKIVP